MGIRLGYGREAKQTAALAPCSVPAYNPREPMWCVCADSWAEDRRLRQWWPLLVQQQEGQPLTGEGAEGDGQLRHVRGKLPQCRGGLLDAAGNQTGRGPASKVLWPGTRPGSGIWGELVKLIHLH